jgi:hypothetical protein
MTRLLTIAVLMLIGYLAGCATARSEDARVVLAWNPNPADENITHYRLWRGLELLGQTAETRLEVVLPTDQISTLTVTAHRGELSSYHSKRLVLAPAVVHSSTDMRVWIVEKSSVFFQTLEREGIKIEKQFFRVNYHTP